MRKMKRVFCLLAALLLVLALPAGAVSSAGLTITPETTMEQLRSDPDVAGSGIWTYQQAIADPSTPAAGTTLGEYVGNMAQDCAAAMDYLTDCYRQGRQVTYKVYMAEEIAAEANRNEVELYYFPSHTEKTKYVVVMSGNVLNKTSNLSEGYATAWQLHELGYTVFVLRYRVFQKASNNAPLDDLGNAIRYITDHAAEFGVQTEDYALLLGYPINDFFEYKPIYHMMMDPWVLQDRYYEWTISGAVTDDYPPVYHWYGMDDYVFPLLWYPAQRPALTRTLKEHHIPYKEVIYRRATHGVGTGINTDADGWINDAVAFWEEQTA